MSTPTFDPHPSSATDPGRVDHGAVPRRTVDRHLLDARGVQWWVHERAATAVVARSLVCESRAAVRRVWAYPADWAALPNAALAALFDVQLPESEP
jgi:hypothetical protein